MLQVSQSLFLHYTTGGQTQTDPARMGSHHLFALFRDTDRRVLRETPNDNRNAVYESSLHCTRLYHHLANSRNREMGLLSTFSKEALASPGREDVLGFVIPSALVKVHKHRVTAPLCR